MSGPARRDKPQSKTVYSTDTGDLRKAPAPAGRPQQPSGTPAPVRVYLDTKHRRGKAVTVAGEFAHNPDVIARLAKDLKNLCGAGGTVEGRSIIIQGDHRARIAEHLRGRGFTVKA